MENYPQQYMLILLYVVHVFSGMQERNHRHTQLYSIKLTSIQDHPCVAGIWSFNVMIVT